MKSANTVVCLFLVFFSLPLFGQSKASSLITNPGFDTYGKCSSESSFACPLGYVVYRSNRTTASVGTTTNPYGNRKLTIRVGLEQGQDKPTIVDVVQTVHQFEPGHLYRFSAWVKAEDLRGESYLFVTAAEDNKAFRTQSNSLGKVHGTSSYSAWTKLNLFFEAPFTQTSIEIGMGVTTSSSDCDAKRCGAVHFDNLSLSRVTNITDMVARESHSNVCSDGEFLNNLSDKCQLLDKQFGHTHEARFNSTVYLKCEEMDSLKINKAIEAFGNAGGVVHLAPCVASLNDDIELASNVILQGSGVGRTVLYRHPDWDNESSTLIRVRGEKEQQLENVVLRDFTVIGSGPIESDMNNIQIRYSHNVLAERIETRNAGKSGISARSSQNVTIRYVIGHGSVRWHGIESKDCYIHSSFDGDDKGFLISRDECAFGIPNFYTENIAVYSNTVFNNRGLGIDSHASFAEIAGNRSINNGSASKFPEPANNIWIHHNEFSDSSREGMKIALQKVIGDATLVPFNQAIYRNIFSRNRGYGIRIHDRAKDIYLIANQYDDNDHDNRLRIVNGVKTGKRVHICSSDESLTYGIDGRRRDYVILAESNSKCDLKKIADIF